MLFGALAVVAGLGSLWAAPSFSPADSLTTAEAAHLRSGSTVARPEAIARGDRRYVGGVAYTIVDAEPDEVTALLEEAGAWHRILPRTRDARRVGTEGGDALVEVTHGSALFQVAYTVRVHKDDRGVRFWLDGARPHDIEDVWGFIHSQPLEGRRALVTYGVLIDMGPGLLRDLFENRVRVLSLTVPDNVRGILLERRGAVSAESLVARTGLRY